MRDRETIDRELRLLAFVRRSIREHGGQPACRQVDELLDERHALDEALDKTQPLASGSSSWVAISMNLFSTFGSRPAFAALVVRDTRTRSSLSHSSDFRTS